MELLNGHFTYSVNKNKFIIPCLVDLEDTEAVLHAQMWARAVVPGAPKAPDYCSSLGRSLRTLIASMPNLFNAEMYPLSHFVLSSHRLNSLETHSDEVML